MVDYNYEMSLAFWEFHETVFNLTAWPKDIIWIGMTDEIHEQTKRGVIRAPNERLNKKDLSKKQRHIIQELKQSILNGELQARFYNLNFLKKYYGTNTSYLLSPIRVIIWSLLKGFILPNKLQKLGLYQQNNIKLFKQYHHDRVKNQIVAQYLLDMNPKFNISQLCCHDWMKLYGTGIKSTDKEKKAIRRAINLLFTYKNKKDRRYYFKQIPEIFLKFERKNFYHFPLLKTFIETSAKIKIEMLGINNFLELTEDDFIKEFFSDKIVQAYLNGASGFVFMLVTHFCYEILEQFYSHSKMKSIPMEKHKKMKIKELKQKHNEFCLNPFTKEERSQFFTSN